MPESFSLAAYYSNVDASAGLVNVAPINDPHIRTGGNYIYLPAAIAKLLGAEAHGVAPNVQAQLRSPSVRKMFSQEINPMNATVLPATPAQIFDRFDNPIPLDPAEPMEALIYTGAAQTHNFVLVWLGGGAVVPVKGDIRTIRATSAIAAVAGTWTNIAPTFTDTMAAGKYQVVGMRFQSTTAIAARLLFPGQYTRPGCLGCVLSSDIVPGRFRNGNAGVWGEFQADTPPSIDILCNAADAAAVQFFWLDVIKSG
jgi:hypothetical protein